jgi:hypothetical protein
LTASFLSSPSVSIDRYSSVRDSLRETALRDSIDSIRDSTIDESNVTHISRGSQQFDF